MSKHYFVAASERLLTEHTMQELLRERTRHYDELKKPIDFWLISNPAFLKASELADLSKKIPQPAAAVISTDQNFITFMKLRLKFVAQGEFEAPSPNIPDPLAEA
ncbi:MAG: MgPME-cyclase complex family protein [Prochlorococcus sp.]|jgi:hypothetical protein|nr:DUF2488 family protein [Prochlorococcaceae cyanobacterium ETNP18_MAG_14]MDP6309395.1 DUF2488 family protein [Prochlorococcaceae cyanobacterium ETNP14_MAG_4]|tara:strand:+ start:2828 stop:3142 length:315 start_codon:yes stop_codon:yes gene_type:complete